MNNPINYFDPNGHLVWSCILGAAISLIVELSIDYFEDDSRIIDHSLNDYFAAGISGAISGGFSSSKKALIKLAGTTFSGIAQGIMTEGYDYNLNSLKKDAIISLVSFGISEGISIVSKRIIGNLINNAANNTTKEAGKQIRRLMEGKIIKNLKPNAKKIYKRALIGFFSAKTIENGAGAFYSFLTGISNNTILDW